MSVEAVNALKAWLKEPGNSKMTLACKLGYRSANTIDSWLKKKKIPQWRVTEVLKAVKK